MSIAVCVDPKHVEKIWFKVEHYIREAIEKIGISSFNDVADDVFHGESLLWLVWDSTIIQGAGITQLIGNVCELVAFGGRLEDCKLIETLEQYASAEGCEKFRILGRKGWTRILLDYSQPYVILEKDLVNGRHV